MAISPSNSACNPSTAGIFSRVMLGTVQFGLPYGIANRSGQPTYADVLTILDVAHQSGVNCLDTAAGYGDSEATLGRALAELGLREALVVVTKVAHLPADCTATGAREHIRASVERSLRHLKLESLPLCLFHREEDYRYADELHALVDQGLVQAMGVSVMTVPGAEPILAGGEATALQLPANLLDHRFRGSGLMERAREAGVPLFVRSVYLQGLLLMPEADVPASLAEVVPIRRRLQTIAADAGLSLAELAARYALSLPGVTSAVIGVDSVAQLRENVALFARGPLDRATRAAIEAAVPPLPDTVLQPTLWQKSPPGS